MASRFWRLVRPDAAVVWRNEEVRRRLSHYYSVMTGSRVAKYRVAKRLPVEEDLTRLSLEELWRLHERMKEEFLKLYEELADRPDGLRKPTRPSFLDLKVEIAWRMLKKCILCERRCGVDRVAGVRGVCGLDWKSRVASAFLHMGEEAPLVPSGTIFFTGCSFKCVFCQNWDISSDPFNGEEIDGRRLAEIAVKLSRMGSRNLNYVGGNPDQHLHTILDSFRYMDVNTPILWNSNFYMSSEAMRLLVDVVDIWLPDFKYGSDSCAERLSRVVNYFEVVSRNHSIAYRYGDMIIRHLVLPGHLECCTKPVLKWIAQNLPRALVNVMGQYRPEYLVAADPGGYPDVARRPSLDEMEEAFRYARELGLCFEPVS